MLFAQDCLQNFQKRIFINYFAKLGVAMDISTMNLCHKDQLDYLALWGVRKKSVRSKKQAKSEDFGDNVLRN